MNESERFYQVVSWLVTGPVAACGACAMEFGIALVEREAGRQVVVSEVCPRPDQRGKTCRARLTLFWNEMPKRIAATKEIANGKPTDDLTARVQQRQQARQPTPPSNGPPAPGRPATIVIPPQRGGIG